MNILFIHKNFPGQFRNILLALANNPKNNVYFITNNDDFELENVNKIKYTINSPQTMQDNPYLNSYEEAVLHGQAAAKVALELKQSGFTPDVIYGHAWGPTLFIKHTYPDTPMVCYFEWFYNPDGAEIGFDGRIPNEIGRSKIKTKNLHLLQDLQNCDAGISPTYWQRKQFPKEYQDKIKVMYDGVDTDFCSPNKEAKFLIKDKNIELTSNDEVITYATRGMEAYRGFPEFMKAVEKLLKKRPNAHFVVGGDDRNCYSPRLENGMTYKEFMLQRLDIDLNRVHFVGGLPYFEYINLLQISSAHVYLTYPFVISWSLLEAMSCGGCVVASNTQPVQEFMKDNYNGLLFDFYNIDEQVKKIEYALDNPKKIKAIRQNARKTIVENYSAKNLLPKQIEYLKSLIRLKID